MARPACREPPGEFTYTEIPCRDRRTRGDELSDQSWRCHRRWAGDEDDALVGSRSRCQRSARPARSVPGPSVRVTTGRGRLHGALSFLYLAPLSLHIVAHPRVAPTFGGFSMELNREIPLPASPDEVWDSLAEPACWAKTRPSSYAPRARCAPGSDRLREEVAEPHRLVFWCHSRGGRHPREIELDDAGGETILRWWSRGRWPCSTCAGRVRVSAPRLSAEMIAR